MRPIEAFELHVSDKPSRLQIAPPIITTERVDGVDIGRIELPTFPMRSWMPSTEVLSAINFLNSARPGVDLLRQSFTFALLNNKAGVGSLPHERAVSAYYTYKPQSTESPEMIIIEWGCIDLNTREAKLHDYLNTRLGIAQRRAQGMQVSSGHLARILEQPAYYALLDKLHHNSETPFANSDLGKVINTLYAYGFIPLTGEGYVQLPAFNYDH